MRLRLRSPESESLAEDASASALFQMPVLRLQSNANPTADARNALRKDLSSSIAAWLGKSEAYVMIQMAFDLDMSFGGANDGCAYCELISLGMDKDSHASLAESIASFLSERLSIPLDRIYIRFESPPRSDFAWNGKPFG